MAPESKKTGCLRAIGFLNQYNKVKLRITLSEKTKDKSHVTYMYISIYKDNNNCKTP